ncbi:hypothetical protein [Halosimplex salinum]|uniref:hypothetical protein n=1 Tax=Halosimplex salinum TaxID=1710538 RepID=UPI000F4A633F|nr:hypothetical protein [Halosimplex salinum]
MKRALQNVSLPPAGLFVLGVFAVGALLLGINAGLPYLSAPDGPVDAEVDSDVEFLESGTEVTINLTQSENVDRVLVESDGSGNWSNGADGRTEYADWSEGVELTSVGETTTNLVVSGEAEVDIYTVVDGERHLLDEETFRLPP